MFCLPDLLRTLQRVPLLILALLLIPTISSAQIGAEYTFETDSDTYTAQTGGTEVISGTTLSTNSRLGSEDAVGDLPIGFDFVFDCVTYTDFSVATSGFMTLGGASYGSTVNNLDGAGKYPILAPFWDFLHLFDGNCVGGVTPDDVGVLYKTTGTAPNRVLEVEWRVQFESGGTTYWYGCTNGTLMNFTAKLYETTNVIEFHYGFLYQVNLDRSGSIGIAAAADDFLSVTPGVPTSASSTTSNDAVNVVNTGITTGTIYRFTPDKVVVTGRTGPGNEGVDPLDDKDTLLADVTVFFGTSNDYTPFDVRKACAAPDADVSMSITGAAAADYHFDVSGTQTDDFTLTDGLPTAPAITFEPTGGGVREATLTVKDNLSGDTRTYLLLAEVDPRIEWRGFPAEGGTLLAEDGDTLLDGMQVIFGNSVTYHPIELENILKPNFAPDADITYTLTDPTGSYALDMTTDAIDGGETSRVGITFNATQGVGHQEATLDVSVDGETRTFVLRAFSAAPGGILSVDGEELEESITLFVNQYACIGEEVISLPVLATNTGTGDFVVNGAEVFLVDGEIQQGRPGYPLERDDAGNPIPMQDYFLSVAPPGSTRNDLAPFPGLIVPEGEERTFYLNIIPTRSGRRSGRIFFSTNGFNLNGNDPEGVATLGLVQVQARASGFGATLVGDDDAKRPGPIVFDRVDVRESATITASLFNDGECDLRINADDFRIITGDVSEFEIVEAFAGVQRQGNDYLIAPGASASVTLRFTPKTYGSRVAQIQLKTNDSTIGDGLVTGRGLFYWEIYGFGDIGVEALGVDFGPTVIDGTPTSGTIRLENTAPETIGVVSVTIEDPSGEMMADPANPWPAFPLRLGPGEGAGFAVIFAPIAGADVGPRDVTALIELSTGEIVRVQLRAFAGTRMLAAAPSAPFAGQTVEVGSVLRRIVGITNVGTLPVRIDGIAVIGPDAASYSIIESGRRVIEPGTTEIVEVTFAPTAAGVTDATLEVTSNATGAAVTADLSAEGVSSGTVSSDPVLTPNGIEPTVEGRSRTVVGGSTLTID